MAKLKNLKVTNVDFVDEGANPDAYIKLYKRKEPEETPGPAPGALDRFFSSIAKALGLADEEAQEAACEVKKAAVSFNGLVEERASQKISDEVWDVCSILASALCSAVRDTKLDSNAATAAMQESFNEFSSLMQAAIPKWTAGKSACVIAKSLMGEQDAEDARAAIGRLTKREDTQPEGDPGNATDSPGTGTTVTTNGTGGEKDMKVDKSKMTPSELAFFEDIEKRYGTEEDAGVSPATTPASATTPTEDVDKGLSPEVRAELDALRKFREESEEKALREVAKKYAIIGKKEDELVPLFKSLKAAGGTAYNDMVSMLDAAVETVGKSGIFTEIGKNGGSGSNNSVEARVEAKAAEVMKAKGTNRWAAIDEVLAADPELRAEYEKEA